MKYILTIILVLPLLATTCVRKKYMIHVENQTAENIYLIPNFQYPDTSLKSFSREVLFANDSIHYVAAHYKKPIFFLELCRREEWRRVIRSDTLQVFVISEKEIKQSTSEEIRAKRPFKSRLLISYDDLVKNNCAITIK